LIRGSSCAEGKRKLQPLLPLFHSGEFGKGGSLRLHLAHKLACVLDGIDFVNPFVTPNRFDSRKPQSEPARMAIARLNGIKSDL
jgi:hypothetical protein